MRAVVLALLLAAAAGPAAAQDISVTFGDDAALATRSIQLIALITLLNLNSTLGTYLSVWLRTQGESSTSHAGE